MALKILTVDDSKTIRMIVKKAFKSYDCSLSEAENGVEGLSIAAKEKPDLIVLDITMPIMNGIEMLDKLKCEPDLKDIPVIMLTAESGKDNVMKIVKMGVKDYIVKPFKGEQLIERAEKLLKLEPKKEEEAEVDLSKKFFSIDEEIQFLALPEKITRPITVEIEGHLKTKIKEMASAGINKFILNLSKVAEVNVLLIKLIISVIQGCQNSKIDVRCVGTKTVSDGLK
ncbi:MAG: response regulator, partial [Thermodesulfobacteriota bacterium]|nr:response regulator [Thermodesulfobacteriota bacterium]